jgi:hypothetical protein
MAVLFLTCFAILKGTAALFDMTMMTLVLAGENDCDMYHDGHGVHAIIKLEFVCPIIQKPFPFKDMTQDFACSHITRYIQQVSTRLPVAHHLKMASPPKSPKPHILRAFDMVLVCLSVPNCFTKHDLRHHIVDSYLYFCCFFPHWVFLGFCLSWHVINSMFITVLPREASLKVHLKGSLALPREMQASLASLRETASSVLPRKTSLAFPREQICLVLLHHLQMLTQNN